MSVSRVKTWIAGEVLTASDLNSEFNNILNNGEDLGWPATEAKDLNGQSLILDADADTSITADTDDQIDIAIAGADDFRITANTFTALSGSTIATNTIAETTADSGVTIDGVLLKDGGATLKDSVTQFQDDGDATKQMRFQLSGITTATTRTITVPDANISLLDIASQAEAEAGTANDKAMTPLRTAQAVNGALRSVQVFGYPTAFSDNFTTNFSSDANQLTLSAGAPTQPVSVGSTAWRLTTSGTLPAPLQTGTDYYIVNVNSTSTIELATEPGGTPVTLTDNGSGTHTIAPLGTWTKPSGLKRAVIQVVSGGGGGGGGVADTGAGGGGGGGYAWKFIEVASLGATETVTVGAGGAGGSAGSNPGNAGGTSSFGSHASATGGAAGAIPGGSGGAGGIGSGGDFNIGGDGGGPGTDLEGQGGGGGSSQLGGGGQGTNDAAGANGRPYGGGGSGASSSSAGGNGATGAVIVEEYY